MSNKTTTREDIISNIIRRQQLWMDASVLIANMLPNVWTTIESHIRARHMMSDLLLIDLQYDATHDILTYSVTTEAASVVMSIPIPFSLALDPGEDGDVLTKYLQTLDNFEIDESGKTVPVQERPISDTPLDKIKSRLKDLQTMHPGMYMDIDRVAELELISADGKFVKFNVPEMMQ